MLHKALIRSSLIFLGLGLLGASPQEDLTEIGASIEDFKKDPRGPYRGLRWFCPDGAILPPRERCSEPGGIQHALPKDIILEFQKKYRIYLGQILAGTANEDFWDAARLGTRLKQYQIEKFLQAIDDGWIMRRARFYRGAFQAEDEEAWGRSFFNWLLRDTSLLRSQLFLIRQAARDIPHSQIEEKTTSIRALAKSIAEEFEPFMSIRIKIHNVPERGDLERIRAFRREQSGKLTPEVEEALLKLEQELEEAYRQTDIKMLAPYKDSFPPVTEVGFQIRKTLGEVQLESPSEGDAKDTSRHLAHLIWVIRKNITKPMSSDARLLLLDLSNQAERLLTRSIGEWQPNTVRGLMEKNHTLAKAAAGCGFLEIWEWEILEPRLLTAPTESSLPLERFLEVAQFSLRAVEWATEMVRAVYDLEVGHFSRFEPLALGFVDDRIRSSILLAFGGTAARLSDLYARYTGISNDVMDLESQGQIRGLNPGIAVGELRVVASPAEEVDFSPDKIYIVLRAPSDLKPVAGIATVSEGNAVSHVQLLARNFGIPNAVLSLQNLHDLAPYSGTRILYAVSPSGTVIMKPTSEISSEEVSLLEAWGRRTERFNVPVDRIDLSYQRLTPSSQLRASDSGRICGPKAANLGRLGALFPDKVPPGIVIPFGVFRRHLDQTMPGRGSSYWSTIQELFRSAGEVPTPGGSDAELRARLATLRAAIDSISFLPEFDSELSQRFEDVFGASLNDLRVFVRSDTNMEDLHDFTGAGLNLTVPNIFGRQEILQAIRDVWASPFTERSYRWRQRFLLNPQAVYPSVLILPAINVGKSGVMVTTGIPSSNPNDTTLAFNWGVGGAVGGQAAETRLLRSDGSDLLISPAREPTFSSLPVEGGMQEEPVHFDRPVLSPGELFQLLQLSAEIRSLLPGESGLGFSGPYDVELGFWNQSLWLFQVRPFVESTMPGFSFHLAALDSRLPANPVVQLDDAIDRP